MSGRKRAVKVLVLSDATGITAERVISAVMVQYGRQIETEIKRVPYLKTERQLTQALDQAQQEGALVIYSLVSRRLRAAMESQKQQRNLFFIDLLGPILSRITNLLHVAPRFRPGLLGLVGEESLRLAECIDFTIRHDDGQGLATLGRADIIILGVSRTSKTPTSLYLSCNNTVKVANIPILLGVEPPAKVFRLKRPRLVGFTIAPQKLALIRQRRYPGRHIEGYTDLEQVKRELRYSQGIFQRLTDIRVIDVTNNSIEETANLIG